MNALCALFMWASLYAPVPQLAPGAQVVESQASALDAPQIDALLRGLEARYANARTYRDEVFDAWIQDRDSSPSDHSWREWRLAFERPDDEIVPAGAAPSTLRWLSDERYYRERAFPSRDILWADGEAFRTWTPRSRSEGRSSAGLGALDSNWAMLPLRLGLHDFEQRPHPFDEFSERHVLGGEAVDGVPCQLVELRRDQRADFALRLWISEYDHSLRRLEHGFFDTESGGFHNEVVYHPRFDEALPASALAYDPPSPLTADLGFGGGVFLLWGLAAVLIALALAFQRVPMLGMNGWVFFVLLSFQAHRAVGFLVTWLLMPAELSDRALDVPWFSLVFLVMVCVYPFAMPRFEWGAFGVNGKQLRAALDRLVQRHGARAEWSELKSSWGKRQVLALPDSGLRLELRGNNLSVRGSGASGERRTWRRALEAQLRDDGAEVSKLPAQLLGVFGSCALLAGLAMALW
ncbi:MAG: hypothetical protein DHS20C15_23910 [Planctomycetota bacterium]|nr:MAG: hypothetical protein DHS20C15_23910 [Planctomycetota bacterium]